MTKPNPGAWHCHWEQQFLTYVVSVFVCFCGQSWSNSNRKRNEWITCCTSQFLPHMGYSIELPVVKIKAAHCDINPPFKKDYKPESHNYLYQPPINKNSKQTNKDFSETAYPPVSAIFKFLRKTSFSRQPGKRPVWLCSFRMCRLANFFTVSVCSLKQITSAWFLITAIPTCTSIVADNNCICRWKLI